MARYADDERQVLPRNDAYTGILAISLFAMLIACLLLFVDYYSYEGMKPPKTKELLTPIGAGKGPGAGGGVKPGPAKQPDQPKKELDKPPADDPKMKKDDAKKDGDKMDKKDDAKKDDAKKDADKDK